MLVRRHQFQGVPVPSSEFPSPVAGSVAHEKNPTTGDVHLYADPTTWKSPLPVLFADCEGLEGGNLEPSSHVYRNRHLIKKDGKQQASSRSARQFRSFVRGLDRRSRPIKWATTEHQKTREYVVKELYPRLLYTFSDVIVFVAKDAQ